MKVLTATQTRVAEQIAFKAGLSGARLMENAGSAATRVIKQEYDIKGKQVVVIAGQGNNGGDGFVVARKLKEYGAKVTVILAMGIAVTPDSNAMLTRARQMPIPVVNFYDDTDLALRLIGAADLLVDAIFGIGFHGAPDREVSEVIRCINDSKADVVALDVPSGVCCDDGAVHGVAVSAKLTVSFIGYKPCHFLFPASEYCGKIVAVSIGIEENSITDYYAEVIDKKQALSFLPAIPKNAHKFSKGTAVIFGGSFGMAGAPMLAAKAAMRSGAGLVRVCLPKSVYLVAASMLPEAVFVPLKENGGCLTGNSLEPEILRNAKSLLIGPGMGCNADTIAAVARISATTKIPTVIDADGLNAIAAEPEILKQCKTQLIFTPHSGEMARLCGVSVAEVEQDRIGIALRFAKEHGVITVLKGAYTVIAAPNGSLFINTTGNEAMATAGSGDMLAGMITAFLANGMSPLFASVAAVCLHGSVGDITAEEMGTRGVLTSDMIDRLPKVFWK